MSSSATILLLVSTIFQFATKIASFFFCGPFLVGGPKNIDQVHLFDLFSTFFFELLFGTVLDGKLVGLITTKLTGMLDLHSPLLIFR